MARTLHSDIVRRRRKEGDAEKRSGQENIGAERAGGDLGNNVGVVGGGGDLGGGEDEMLLEAGEVSVGGRSRSLRRERKVTEHFQFDGEHALFSKIKEKSKQKKVSAKENRDKVGRHYGRKQFLKLKKQVVDLKEAVKKQGVLLKKKDRKINSLQKKQ